MEIQFLDMLTRIHTPWLDRVMVFITSLGDHGALWIFTGLLLLLIKRYRKVGILLLAALFFSFLICNVLLKNLAARERPFSVNPQALLLIPPPQDFSFPSGHTSISFAAARILYSMHKWVGAAAFIVAALIMFSRLYLYVHFPTDVIGGIVTGLLSAWMAEAFVSPLLDKVRFL